MAKSNDKQNGSGKAAAVRYNPKPGERPVIVTTVHRGVFFGWSDATDGETIRLNASRMCIYWSTDMKGFMGLAYYGPSDTCRIGPPVTITVRNVTSVTEVEPDAVPRWEAAPWKTE